MGFWIAAGFMVMVIGMFTLAISPMGGTSLVVLGAGLIFWGWVLKNLDRHFGLLERQNVLLIEMKGAIEKGILAADARQTPTGRE